MPWVSWQHPGSGDEWGCGALGHQCPLLRKESWQHSGTGDKWGVELWDTRGEQSRAAPSSAAECAVATSVSGAFGVSAQLQQRC